MGEWPLIIGFFLLVLTVIVSELGYGDMAWMLGRVFQIYAIGGISIFLIYTILATNSWRPFVSHGIWILVFAFGLGAAVEQEADLTIPRFMEPAFMAPLLACLFLIGTSAGLAFQREEGSENYFLSSWLNHWTCAFLALAIVLALFVLFYASDGAWHPLLIASASSSFLTAILLRAITLYIRKFWRGELIPLMKRVFVLVSVASLIILGFSVKNYYYPEVDLDLAAVYHSEGKNLFPERGECRTAIRRHTAAIRWNRDFALAYLHRGRAYHAMDRPKRAAKDFEKAVRLNPAIKRIVEDQSWVNRGYCRRDNYD